MKLEKTNQNNGAAMSNLLADKLNEQLAKLKRSIQKPNVLISGITGVGKSTLVNI